MFFLRQKQSDGFTLIEVLLVIAILAILASVVIIAINPAKQLKTSRDAQRRSDVHTILNALYQYALDNGGTFPGSITTDEREICRTGVEDCPFLYDLSELTSSERYLISVPIDPLCEAYYENCEEIGVGYFLKKTGTGRITVTAYGAESEIEQGEISVTR